MLSCNPARQGTTRMFTTLLIANADYWKQYRKVLGYENIGECPELRFNRRLKTTLGRAFIGGSPAYTELSLDYVELYPDLVLNNWLQHELAHHVAFRVYGDEGHGKGWKRTLRDLNINTSVYHTLVNTRWAPTIRRRRKK